MAVIGKWSIFWKMYDAIIHDINITRGASIQYVRKIFRKTNISNVCSFGKHAERNHGNSYDGDNDFEICFASKLPSKLPVMSSWTKVNKQNKMFYLITFSKDLDFVDAFSKLSFDDCVKSLETNYWAIS